DGNVSTFPGIALIALVRDGQNLPTSFAVDRIGVVTLKRASRAGEQHLCRANKRLSQADKQRDPDDHGCNGYELPTDARKNDVAEAGGRDGRDRKVKRVHVTGQAGIGSEEEAVHKPGDDEEKR